MQTVKRHFQTFHQEQGAHLIPVMCFPFNDILATINVTHIDFLSLDIVGLEVEVLENVNWKKFRIDIMTIEIGHRMTHLERLRKLLKPIGYREVGLIGADVVFEREDPHNEWLVLLRDELLLGLSSYLSFCEFTGKQDHDWRVRLSELPYWQRQWAQFLFVFLDDTTSCKLRVNDIFW